MTHADLVRRRLSNQHVSREPLAKPEQVVKRLGAVQAQDYGAAKWALALRSKHAMDSSLDARFAKGAILRTHVMRPTWHFVAPEDIRWLLMLTGPRVQALMAGYYRKMELDVRTLKRSAAVLEKALAGGNHLTRAALGTVLRTAGVFTSLPSMRLAFVLLYAELEALICSGPRHGKQFTYALLEERVPSAPSLTRAQALIELVRRFFTSHGPATINDFVWWSGLTVKDTQSALPEAGSSLERVIVGDRTYFGPKSSRSRMSGDSDAAYLLPVYDEAMLPYRDNRSEFAGYGPQLMRDNGQVIVIDGRVVATWRRVVSKSITIEVDPIGTLGKRQRSAVEAAVERYGAFLNVPASAVFGR
jgi:hypothetical protein